MATEKNITMKQFNGTDYDTLYPKTVAAQIDDVYSKDETYPKSQLYTQSQLYTRQQILADSTKGLYGLGSDAVPDDMWVNLVPVGGILWYAKDGIPNGYLKCDGSVISRVDYKRLFDVIGITFGTGNGSTTFSLPDLRAKFIRGSGSSGHSSAVFGATQLATETIISKLSDANVSVLCGSGIANYDYANSVGSGTFSAEGYPSTTTINSYGNRPYNIALTPIIKY